MRAFLKKILALLTSLQRRQLALLVAVNTASALVEAVSIFSVLPFLRLAGDPSLIAHTPFLQAVYDRLGFSSPQSFLIASGFTTIVAILLMNIVGVVSLWFRSRFCFNVVGEMSSRLFAAYLRQPYTFMLKTNTALLAKDVLNEVLAFYTNVLDPLTGLLARGLQSLFVIAALLFFSPAMTLLAAAVFVVFYACIYVWMHRRLKCLGDERWATNERRYQIAGEALGGFREVRLFDRSTDYIQRFDSATQRNAATQSTIFLYNIVPRYIIEVVVFGSLVAAVLVALRTGESLSDVVPVLAVFAVAGARLMPAIQTLFQYAATLRANTGAVNKLADLFRATQSDSIVDQAVQPQPLPITGSIVFDDVSYWYPDAQQAALKDVSLEIPARSCIGVYGPSGAGKSTFVDLLLGLLTPSKGRILIDGKPLDKSCVRAWQRNVGYVPQAIFLIDATIAENIAFGSPEGETPEALRSAARFAHISEFIDRLPEGYETLVGERGARMSGGQRQRLAIARALYRQPEVIVFDEATSALDSDNEAAVVEAVQTLSHSKTTIIVAHRRSTLKYCDRIFCFDKSRLVAICSYADLESGKAMLSATASAAFGK